MKQSLFGLTVLFFGLVVVSSRVAYASDDILLSDEVHTMKGNFLATGGIGLQSSETLGFVLSGSLSYRLAPKWRIFSEVSLAETPFTSEAGPSTSEKNQTYLLGGRYQFWRWFFAETGLGYRHTSIKSHDRTTDPWKVAKLQDFVGTVGGGILDQNLDPLIFGIEINGVFALDRITLANDYDSPISRGSVEAKGFVGVSF